MPVVASVTIAGIVSALQTGSKTLEKTIAAPAANGVVQQIVLQSGANTITVPTAANSVNVPSGCIINLPLTNTNIVTLKGVTGDTGIAIGKTTTQVLTWDVTAPPTSFVLTSAATQTGLFTEITFF